MNIRKNNGYTGVDISIAIIIILIFIPTICGIAYNIHKIRLSAECESKAINVASDILEIAKSKQYDDITLLQESSFITELNSRYLPTSDTNTEEADFEYIYYIANVDNKSYQIQIGLKNYYPTDVVEENKQDLMKIIKIKLFYYIGSTQKSVDISMVIQDD